MPERTCAGVRCLHGARPLRHGYDAACEHWDRILNENHAAALKVCASASDPETCRSDVRKAERLWGQYKEAMADALMELDGGGSLVRLSSLSFLTEETRKQARLLGTAGR